MAMKCPVYWEKRAAYHERASQIPTSQNRVEKIGGFPQD